MARPRKDANEPDACERLREALWQLLGEEPFDRISVSELCQRAHVQRNTFYYHYEGIYDLVQDSIAHLPAAPVAQGLMETIASEEGDVASYILAPEQAEIVSKVMLIAGPHGSPLLMEAYKTRIWSVWTSLLDLPEKPPMVFDFAFGGLMTMLAKLQQLPVEERRHQLEQVPIKPMFETLLTCLGASLKDGA